MQQKNGKLAVLFPGIGYHKDKPLLYYAGKLCAAKDCEIRAIEYSDMPKKIRGNAAMMEEAAKLAYRQAEEQLAEVDFAAYKQIIFIGKSIGTVALAKYAADHQLTAKQIWYTPVEATFLFASAGENENIIAFLGDADPWSDVEKVKQTAKQLGISLYSYPDCNHSLECESVDQNLENLREVMRITDAFLS